LPDVVQNVAKLFADDTKLYAAVNNTNDEIKLQGDIDRSSVHFELDPLSTTFCLRSDKKFLIHSRIFPDIP
jgi:hypothetical protein